MRLIAPSTLALLIIFGFVADRGHTQATMPHKPAHAPTSQSI